MYTNDCILIYQYKKNVIFEIEKIPNISVEFVNHRNIRDVIYFQSEEYLRVFESFLKMGDVGYYAYLNMNCIHRSWIKFNSQIVETHWAYKFKLKCNQAFIHYCETASEARGMGIYPFVLRKIISDFNEKYDIFISVDGNNLSSQKGIEKAGFEVVERVKIKVIFGFKYVTRIRI